MALFKQWDTLLKSKEKEPTVDLRRQVLFDKDDENREKFAKLCQIAVEGGRTALRQYFDNLFPPDQIAKQLAFPENHKVLRRLRIRKIITEDHWAVLYPENKKNVSSSKFDLSLLGVMLKYVCHIPKPWPNGWTGDPNDVDRGPGATYMRYQLLRREMAKSSTLTKSAMSYMYRQLRHHLGHFGGDSAKELAEQRWKNSMDNEEQSYWLDEFRKWHSREEDIWDREMEIKLAKQQRTNDIPVLRRKLESRDVNSDKQPVAPVRRVTSIKPPDTAVWDRWAGIPGGMVEEERRLLNKYYGRLVTEVKPDSLIEHLTINNLLTMEESNDVFSILKTSEQMDILLEILVSKSGHHTFDIFIEGLRLKYTDIHKVIYEDLKKVMDAILASKPDGIPYCQGLLRQSYRTSFSNWTPILWYGHEKVDLLEFYLPLKILNIQGKQVNPENLLSADPVTEKIPRWVVVEGEAGTGKSTLAQSLAYRWVNNEKLFGRQFKLLFYINLKILAPNIKVMMTEQLFGTNFKLTERELWDVIEEHQDNVLFLLDSYEDNISDEIQNILFGSSLPNAAVVLFTNSIFTARLQDQYDRKFIVTGFAKRRGEEFVRKYAKIARKPVELFNGLLQKLSPPQQKMDEIQEINKIVEMLQQGSKPPPPSRTNTLAESIQSGQSRGQSRRGSMAPSKVEEEEPVDTTTTNTQKVSALRYYAQFPIYCSYFCMMTDMKLSLELTSWTNMNEQFMTALKMKLIEKDRESRFAVNKAYTQLTEIAFDTVKKGFSTILIREEDDQLLVRFGVLQEATNLMTSDNHRYFFPSRLVQEYLAAKCLDTSSPDESARYFQNFSLTRSIHTTVAFYCGMRKHDCESQSMRALLEKLLENNRRRRAMGVREEGHIAGGKTEGRIMDFQLALECMALMEGKNAVANNIVSTLPSRVLVKYKGIIPALTIQGLSYLISLNSDHITELDIRLDLLSRQTPDAYQRLAEGITHSSKIQVLRVFWTQRDHMSQFLAGVCAENQSIETLQCIDESTKESEEAGISGKVWKNLRQALETMTNVTSFAFRNCKYTALVCAIIRNLPLTLHELDLSGCEINIIASQDLGDKMTLSKQMHTLVLSDLKIEGLAFNTFIKALGSNRSITSMILSGVKLDTVCFFALAEALKVNNKLMHLDLRRVGFVNRSCEELAQVMKINTTLRRLQVTALRIPQEGRDILRKNAKHMTVEGIEAIKRASYYEDDLVDVQKFQD